MKQCQGLSEAIQMNHYLLPKYHSFYGQLKELMRFRHFRRYYFELEYDWDKLDFLVKKFTFLRGTIGKELSIFKDFLSQLKQG